MDEKKEYYIGEISKELNVSQRTIRYYEELGFIKPGRSFGRFRIYDQSAFNRLCTILHLKDLGMTLEEIGTLFNIIKSGSVHDISPKLREILLSKKKEFESRLEKYKDGIKELEEILSIIQYCENCNNATDPDICHSCIDERTKDLNPQIKGIL